MGVGVSRSGLAAAVANVGAIGVISAVQIGFDEVDFASNNVEANLRSLRKHIQKAKELCSNGILGVNILAAMKIYKEMAIAAIEEGIDIIISGAGLPLDLPALVANTKTKIAPIVSSGKAAALICKVWDKRYNRTSDMVVVEGPEAGGHLGFSKEELEKSTHKSLDELVLEVVEAIKPYEDKYNVKIPVIAAGGVFTGEDIARCLKLGASGVQMSTRFIATHECDAHINFKNAIVNSKEEDMRLVKSPVGMPGRAINNVFTKKLDRENISIDSCLRCLIPCKPNESPYCISKALINSVTGNIDEGLVFSGSNGYRVEKIVSVKELVEELVSETEKYL